MPGEKKDQYRRNLARATGSVVMTRVSVRKIDSVLQSANCGIEFAFSSLHLAFGTYARILFAGGYYGLSGAEGVPTEWLEGGPFADYFVPSLILFVIVGGSLLVAAAAVLARLRFARLAAFGAGAVVLGWIAAQMSIIGYVSWMQPTTALAGVLVLMLAWRLKKPSGGGAW
jgi:hypothetical protein